MAEEFVKYSPALKHRVVELRRRAYGGTHAFNAAYFEWKYEQNPYLRDPMLHLVLADGLVVGMRGLFGTQWQIGSAGSWLMPAAADFAIDSDHRGRWLDLKLIAFADKDLVNQGYNYVCTTSANLTSRLLRLRTGSKRAATYHTFRRGYFPDPSASRKPAAHHRPGLVSRARRRLERTLRSWRPFVPFRRFDDWAARVNSPISAMATPRLANLSELVSRYSDPNAIQHTRDEKYYAWRLRDPRSRYRYVFYERGDVLEGFLILQQAATGGAVTVVDWTASTTSVWMELLHAVVESGIRRLQIASTKFSEQQTQALNQLGFDLVVEPDTRTHPAPGILLNALSSPDADRWTLADQYLLDQEKWDMRMIYSDAF